MVRTIKAVIFDCGGVLTTSTEDILDKDIAEAFDLKLTKELVKTIEECLDEFELGAVSHERMWQKFAEKVNRPLPEEYRGLISKHHDTMSKIHENVIYVVKKLKQKNYIVGMLSNTNEIHARFNKKRGLLDYFKPIIMSHEVHLLKPGLEIYELLLKRLKIKAEECIFVDDKQENIDAANKVGINGITYRSPKQLIHELAKHDVVF